MPAFQADAQVKPLAAGGQAVLATIDGLRKLGDKNVIEVRAIGHFARILCLYRSGYQRRGPRRLKGCGSYLAACRIFAEL
jgi:hypothetical protein